MRIIGLGSLLIKIAFILFSVFIFFFAYNKFLVDHSLKSLEFSLTNINQGSVAGVDDVLKNAAALATSKDNFREAVKFDYALTSLQRKETIEDVSLLIASSIKTTRFKRGIALNMLDKVALFFENLTGRALSFGRKKSLAALSEDFNKAKALFEERDFKNARKIFSGITRFGYGTVYGRSAGLYLKNIEIYQDKENKIKRLLRKVSAAKKVEESQELYYQIANLYMEVSDFKKADEYFAKVSAILPASETAQKAYVGSGFAKKMQGKFDEAANTLNDFLKKNPGTALTLQAKLQLADILRRQNKHEQAAVSYYALAKQFSDSVAADVMIFNASCIYRFDLNRAEDANRLLIEMCRDYPASDLIEAAKKLYPQLALIYGPSGFLDMETGKGRQPSFKEQMLLSLVRAFPPFDMLFRLAEKGAVWFALYMIEGSIIQALLQKKKKGDILVIERTSKFLTKWVQDRLIIFLEQFKQYRVSLENFSITFPREGWVAVNIIVGLGNLKWESSAVGTMYLKKIDVPYGPWEEEEKVPTRWVVFDIKKVKLGPFEIPKVIANELIKKAEATFNKKQVFRQERLKISPFIGVWAGKMKYDKVDLLKKLQEIEILKKKGLNF